MLKQYAPILVLFALVVGFAVANLIMSELFGAKRKNIDKGLSYECGMRPSGSSRIRVSIHFYLVAVLFIVFDVESLFLILWAATARTFTAAGLGWTVFWQVFAFIALLVVALVYEWRKGGLEWDR